MRKWIGLLKSIIFSFVVYMWFLGSTLLLRIDSNQVKEEQKAALLREQWAIKMEWEGAALNLTANIESYCNLQQATSMKNGGGRNHSNNQLLGLEAKKSEGEKAAREAVLHAKREKTIRDNIIYIPQLRQLWCLVPKAASTSWSHKILDAIPDVSSKLQRDLRNESIPIQVILRKYYGNVGTKKYYEILESKNMQKIVLARHPLSRLVSAFEDKLKDRKARVDSMYFYGHYGVKINRAFRKNRRLNKRKEPTFEEFIDYLIKTDPEDYDEHWKPISLLCGLCRIKYNHIIKQEDLKSDLVGFHLTKLGYNNDLEQSPGETLRRENKSSKQFNTVRDYFQNVTAEKKHQLLEKYKDDFTLFQYNMEGL